MNGYEARINARARQMTHRFKPSGAPCKLITEPTHSGMVGVEWVDGPNTIESMADLEPLN